MKRNDVTQEFGDVNVNFDARIQCRLCTEKIDSHVLLDLHLFTVHQQETVCQIVSFYQGPLLLEFSSRMKLGEQLINFRLILKIGGFII